MTTTHVDYWAFVIEQDWLSNTMDYLVIYMYKSYGTNNMLLKIIFIKINVIHSHPLDFAEKEQLNTTIRTH